MFVVVRILRLVQLCVTGEAKGTVDPTVSACGCGAGRQALSAAGPLLLALRLLV